MTISGLTGLTGCSYYSNQTRQANLDIDLAKYRSTMQIPATTITPAKYVVCDDRLYPCGLITPMNLAQITQEQQSILNFTEQKQIPKKHFSKHARRDHHHSKRTTPCKS